MCEFHSVTSRAEEHCETSMKFSDKKLSCFSIDKVLNSAVTGRISLQGLTEVVNMTSRLVIVCRK